VADQVLTLTKVYPFPKRNIADPDICNKIDILWKNNKDFLILSGPPGVGKTRSAEDYIYKNLESGSSAISAEASRIDELFPDFRSKVYKSSEIAAKLIESKVRFVWDLVVLHPQYSYEDLIRGYKVFSSESGATLKVREGVLGFISRVITELEAIHGKQIAPYGVLILDEINRAPIGQLFGEAIYALDRRGAKTTTPYELDDNGCSLIIPNSLLILGTMNSIDRATSGFDFALRRRFANIMVNPSVKAVEEAWNDAPSTISRIGSELFDLCKKLVLDSQQIGTIPKDELVLGHAYFIPPIVQRVDEISYMKWMVISYMYQILPTLLDYEEQGLIEFPKELASKLPFGDILLGIKDMYHVEESQIELEFLEYFNVNADK
jgi:hypothetical protein